MERVLLIGLKRARQTLANTQTSLEELSRLVETAGGSVVDRTIQPRARFDPATLIGRGKVVEVAERVRRGRLQTVVFDDDLSPAQQRNLEREIPAKILDRTHLILDIFAQRARTREGILQVEFAQLSYRLPRLGGLGVKLSQQVGGIGTRGPGERMLEVDRRHLRERIRRLRVEIERIQDHRERARENRLQVPLPQVALIGYTNAGKSTLLNTLTSRGSTSSPRAGRVHPELVEGQIYADDKLFATLDPTTRRVKLPGGRVVLFTDTVGFIQKLPHHLVAAFRATLEEVTRANLLVHVVDASNPRHPEQMRTVAQVIKDLGGEKIPALTAYNKADRLGGEERQALDRRTDLRISATSGEGIETFLKTVEAELDKDLIEVSFELPYGRRDLLSGIYKTGRILEETPAREGTKLRVRIDPAHWRKIAHQLKRLL